MARFANLPRAFPAAAGLDPAILAGRWLVAARITWLAIAVVAVGLTLAAAPIELRHLTTVCAGEACPDPHLTPVMAAELAAAGISPIVFGGYLLGVELVAVAVFVIVAAAIMRAGPRQPIALLAALLLVSFGPSIGPMSSLTGLQPVVGFIGFVAGLSLFAFVFTFPQGRFVPRWTLWLALPVLAWQVPDTFFRDSPISTYRWPQPFGTVAWVSVAAVIGFIQIYRYRRISDAAQRQQTRWVVAGLVLTACCFAGVVVLAAVLGQEPNSALGFALGGTAYYLALVPLPLSIGVGIFRDRLWGLEAVIGRGLFYLGLTAAVIGIYAAIVVGVAQLLAVDNTLLSLLATGVVAVLFQPMRLRLQRLVGRLLYGERDDPYAVLSRLGRRLDEALEPDAVLPTIVATLASTLRLPYVAIGVGHGNGMRVAAAYGEAAADVVRLPLTHRGEEVGELLIGLRAGERAFAERELVLLRDVARQASAAAHAVRLTSDLRRSRESLVLAREEERRRLRRDLHDGLGPAVASVTLMADAARNLLSSDPSRTDALLAELKAEARSATAEVRRVVYELRPAALDELGLVGSIREQAAQYAQAGVAVDVRADDLGELSAAIEVAVYRIVSEAMTNVMRHARARSCRVTLRRDAGLFLEVADDGRGMAGGSPGVGTATMRERAEELGGTLAISSSASGTIVTANLPLPGGG
jgi:signal transduction histidine kinase